MSALTIAFVVSQIILSLILVIVVLFQHGSQRGLSGSIAGGAETFFGKNKGRTIDAKLKKWTSVVAVLFLISSIGLSLSLQSSNTEVPDSSDISMEDMQIDPNSLIEESVTEGEIEEPATEGEDAIENAEEPVTEAPAAE